MTTTVEFLSTVPVLAELDASDLGRLAELLKPCPVNADAVVIREGDSSEEMYFVVAGELNVSERVAEGQAEQHGAPLHRFGKGDLFGELGFFDGCPRSAAVYATTPSELLALRYEDLQELIRDDSTLASRLFLGMLRNLCAHLRNTNEGIKLLYKRLIKYDTSMQSILRIYSEDEELSHLFRGKGY